MESDAMPGGGVPEEERAPQEIDMGQHVMRLAMHGSANVLSASTVTGDVGIFEYGLEGNHQRALLQHHKMSTRALEYSHDGSTLFMGSKDCSISAYNLSGACLSGTMTNAHEAPVSCLRVVDENVLVSGDDDGTIKIWDMRQARTVHELTEHGDFISDIQLAKDGKTILCSGGDGYLSIWNRKSGKLIAMSDEMDDEFLSIQIVKNGRKVVLGTQSGVLAIFSWGNWGDMSDRFIGHPQSVESMVKVDEDSLITCSEDGIIRVIQLQPNKLLGVIGEHDGYPVEHVAVSHDFTYLSSCSHDNTVKFWNIAYLYGEDDVDEEEGEEGEEGEEDGGLGAVGMSDGDSDDSSDSEEERGKRKPNKRKGGRKKLASSTSAGFYADM